VNYPKEEWPIKPVGPMQELKAVHPLWNWDAKLKEPKEWSPLLFEGILRQPLGGGKFEYDSESLKALSIIED